MFFRVEYKEPNQDDWQGIFTNSKIYHNSLTKEIVNELGKLHSIPLNYDNLIWTPKARYFFTKKFFKNHKKLFLELTKCEYIRIIFQREYDLEEILYEDENQINAIPIKYSRIY